MSGIDYISKSTAIGLKNLAGGLNSSSSGLSLADNESSGLQNIDFDKFGAAIKRNGYTALNTSAINSGATGTGLHWYAKSDGTEKLFGAFGNKFYRMDDLDGTWDDITGAITVTAGNNNLVSSATFLDTALFTNGVDAPWTATDSGNAAAMSVPTSLTTAKFVEIFNNYTFLANVALGATSHRSRVYWSTINSISSWSSTDFNDVNRNDGQEITGLKSMGDRLVIFKNYSIWIATFTGDTDVPFVFQQTPSSVGCIAPFSIQLVNNGIIFLAQDGIYFFDGSNSYKISDRITNTLNLMNKSRYKYATSCYQREKNRYWLSLSESAFNTNNTCIAYDTFNNAFSVYSGHNANCFTIVNTTGQERPYFSDYSGYCYRADTGLDDYPLNSRTAINAWYYTKWISFEDLVNQKGVPSVYIYFQITNGNLTFSYSYDFEIGDQYVYTFPMYTSTAVYGTAIYGTDVYASDGGSIQRQDLDGRGRVIRLKFANNVLGETFEIDGYGQLLNLETNV